MNSDSDIRMEEPLDPSLAIAAERPGEKSFEEQIPDRVDVGLEPSQQLMKENLGPSHDTDGDGLAPENESMCNTDPRPEFASPTEQFNTTKPATEHEAASQRGDSQSVNDGQSPSKPDEDDRWTQLHAAVEAGDHDQVQKLMDQDFPLEDGASDGRKPLFIAAEKGFAKIVELLAARASIESLNDMQNSTALIRACEENHIAVVKILVERGANIEAKRSDGQTPLLIAISSRNHDLLKYMLQHGADKTVITGDGASAERLAEDDEEMTKILKQNFLLQGPKIGTKRSVPEPRLRNIRAPEKPGEYKLAACEAFQAEVVQFFIGRREQRSQPVRVSIYELIYGKGPDPFFSPPLMSPPLASPDSSRPSNTARGKPTFTWYHIPSNNKAWVNDLILRLLSERRPDATMPDDSFKSKMGLHSMKGRGTSLRNVAFSFERPFAKTLKTDSNTAWDGKNMEQAVSFVPFLNYETFLGYFRMMGHLNQVQAMNSKAMNLAHRLFPMRPPPPPMSSNPFSYHPFNPPPPPPPAPPSVPHIPNPDVLGFSPPPPAGLVDLNIRGGSGPPSPTRQSRPLKGSQKRFLGFFSGGKPPKKKRKDKKLVGSSPGWVGKGPHELLTRGYGVAERDGQVPLQPRRTLDQYFYSHLDNTAQRDRDQVVFRYTNAGNQGPKIFMVDQMWLWIFNGDTLITCIPDRWNDGIPGFPPDLTAAVTEDLLRGPSIERPRSPSVINEPFMTAADGGLNSFPEMSDHMHHHDNLGPINENGMPPEPLILRVSPPTSARRSLGTKPVKAYDPMNVHDRVAKHLKETSRKPIESIYDLAGLIATCCASAFDENQIPDEMQFFDFFERSIGSVIDKATKSLHEFKKALREQNTHQSDPSNASEKASLGDEPMDDDLNIASEIDLLVEIEDIQDELHILRVVLRDQKRTLRQLDDILIQGKKKHGLARNEGEVDSMIDTSCIEHHTARITEMEKLAEKAHKSLYHLIDLKQKQANFSEAISARKLARETAKNTQLQIKQSEEISKQAEETARQGKTLMVFTVVTIIFLPLSFMAAFFAINIDAFPVNQDGKIEFGYVLKYMLSISLALAIPFVLLALRINDVKHVGHSAYKGVRRAWASPRLLPVVGYVTLGLLVAIVPAIVWTSQLATTAKVAITVLLAITVLFVAIGVVMKWLIAKEIKRMTLANDNSSYFSGDTVSSRS